MFLARESGGEGACTAVADDFFRESLRVFSGELTCCRLEHKNTRTCDRLSLVVPLLGLYGELYRASLEGEKGGGLKGVVEYLSEIERHQDEIFPRTFKMVSRRKGRKVEEEVLLFGDLIDRMRARVRAGAAGGGVSGNTTATGSLSRKSSTGSTGPGLREGASPGTRPRPAAYRGRVAR